MVDGEADEDGEAWVVGVKVPVEVGLLSAAVTARQYPRVLEN